MKLRRPTSTPADEPYITGGDAFQADHHAAAEAAAPAPEDDEALDPAVLLRILSAA